MKISLCMIAKNEEENIINCLDRALKVVGEAIIVDTGSTDKTKKLLVDNYENDSRVKIIEEDWQGDFSKARNKSLEYATGDWILILDADERIFCDSNKLEIFLNDNEALAYKIPIYNIIDKDNLTISTSMIRLYKNNNPKYKGAIHEQIEIDGKAYVGEIIDGEICKIYHYGYNSNVFHDKEKSKRNMDIINAEIKKNAKDPFNWYNKAVMEMIEGNFDMALDDFVKSHKLCNNVRSGYHNDLLIRMIQCMIMLKNYKQAAKFTEDILADAYMKDIPDTYYYLGICYVKLKKYDLAIKNFEKATNIGEYYEGISKYGVGSFLSIIEWAKTLELKKEKLLAIEKYKEAVFNKNNIGMQGLDELKRLLKKENMMDELNQLEETLSNSNNKEESINNNNELEESKKEFKENIQMLIEKGMLKEAKEAVEEYEKIVKDDIDIYSTKGVISMMEGDMDGAEKIFRQGLEIQTSNNDILYNLAYLFQVRQDFIQAYRYYHRLNRCGESKKLINEIDNILQQYEKMPDIIQYKKNISEHMINGLPKVSILITTYNQKEYLKEAIESALKQDYPNLEIVIGDDCSTDGTDMLMKEYQGNSKIKYIRHNKNLGAGNNTTNLLYNHIDSKYVLILNHDDYLIKNDYISKAVDFMNYNPKVSLVWANCKIKNEHTKELFNTEYKNARITNGIEYFINYETEKYPHITGVMTSVFDWEKLINMKYGYEITKSKDVFLYLKLMLCGDVGFFEECAAVYRVHNNSISNNMPLDFDQPTIEELEKLKKYALEQNIASNKQMEIWINNRVYSYVIWRFTTMWNTKKRNDALNLLNSISTKYPIVYEKILNSI